MSFLKTAIPVKGHNMLTLIVFLLTSYDDPNCYYCCVYVTLSSQKQSLDKVSLKKAGESTKKDLLLYVLITMTGVLVLLHKWALIPV